MNQDYKWQVAKAVRRLATAEGYEATVAALEQLRRMCDSWLVELSVTPGMELRNDQALERALERATA